MDKGAGPVLQLAQGLFQAAVPLLAVVFPPQAHGNIPGHPAQPGAQLNASTYEGLIQPVGVSGENNQYKLTVPEAYCDGAYIFLTFRLDAKDTKRLVSAVKSTWSVSASVETTWPASPWASASWVRPDSWKPGK